MHRTAASCFRKSSELTLTGELSHSALQAKYIVPTALNQELTPRFSKEAQMTVDWKLTSKVLIIKCCLLTTFHQEIREAHQNCLISSNIGLMCFQEDT